MAPLVGIQPTYTHIIDCTKYLTDISSHCRVLTSSPQGVPIQLVLKLVWDLEDLPSVQMPRIVMESQEMNI